MFIQSLKKSGRLDRIQIKVCIVGSRKINNQDDYGSQGWEIFAPNLTIYGFDADADTCCEANTNLNSRQVSWTEKHIPVGLSDSIGKSKLYITKYPGCSSLYPPSESYIERFTGNSELIRVVDSMEIETTTLDEFCNSEGIEEIDFIQLDVQGAELSVLKGAASILERGTLGIITEVEFTELYTGQPLFGDIDVYLRQQGFTLFDLSNQHRDIRRVLLTSEKHQGVLVWSDAFYFRDLINQNASNQHLQTPEKILKLACIADVLSFPDYTLELLIYLTLQYGADEKYNFADIIIECLAQIRGIFQEWNKLSNSPIIKQVIAYSSSYRIGSIETNSICDSQFSSLLSKAAYQYLLLGDYSQAASLYEKAIELEPALQSNYWYLGLVLLLEGEDAEAQSVWFFGINQGEAEKIDSYILELIEVLQTEAIRRGEIADNLGALTIREAIKIIAPENVVRNVEIKYSHLDEEHSIEKYLNSLDIKNKYCVDIAASDGITMSNTCFLFEQGWSGLAIECDSEKFAALAVNYRNFPNVILSKSFITPENAVAVLEAHQVPKDLGFLNLDIDGYDYFVLDKILSSFRPSLICTEINEKIPPPLKFTVKWDSNYVWENNHFYGQSICQLYLLCEKYEYSLVELHYNNAFLIPKELNPHLSLTPDEAYRHGYLECSDRQNKFPWNADFETIYSLTAEQALDYVNKFFANYQGKYICSL